MGALSHVSSEVREDGLLLLELYASRLSGMQVLSGAESSRIVQTLCQQKARTEVVLRCLYRLLLQTSALANDPDGQRAIKTARVTLQGVIAARSVDNQADDVTGDDEEMPDADVSGTPEAADSPIWEFCLR